MRPEGLQEILLTWTSRETKASLVTPSDVSNTQNMKKLNHTYTWHPFFLPPSLPPSSQVRPTSCLSPPNLYPQRPLPGPSPRQTPASQTGRPVPQGFPRETGPPTRTASPTSVTGASTPWPFCAGRCLSSRYAKKNGRKWSLLWGERFNRLLGGIKGFPQWESLLGEWLRAWKRDLDSR